MDLYWVGRRGKSRMHIIGVTASSLDDPGWFKSTMDIFVCDAQPWDLMEPDSPKHQQYMPRW